MKNKPKKIRFSVPLLTILTLGGCSNAGKLSMQSSDSEEEEIAAIVAKSLSLPTTEYNRPQQYKGLAPRWIVSITNFQDALETAGKLVQEIQKEKEGWIEARTRVRREIREAEKEIDNANLTTRQRMDLREKIYEMAHNITNWRTKQTMAEQAIEDYKKQLPCVQQQLTNGESIDVILKGTPFGRIYEIVYNLTKELIEEKRTTIYHLDRYIEQKAIRANYRLYDPHLYDSPFFGSSLPFSFLGLFMKAKSKDKEKKEREEELSRLRRLEEAFTKFLLLIDEVKQMHL